MRERALIHVAGPAGAGKTTFIERLLDAEVAFAIPIDYVDQGGLPGGDAPRLERQLAGEILHCMRGEPS